MDKSMGKRMNKITLQMLEALVNEINSITKQSDAPWASINPAPSVKNVIRIGNYHLSGSSLRQMASVNGGTKCIFACSSKRELFNLLHAFITGLKTASPGLEREYKAECELKRKAS